jgi:hypothetical protein
VSSGFSSGLLACKRSTAVILGFVILSGLGDGRSAARTQPDIRIPALIIGPPNDGQLQDILDHPDQWRAVHRQVGGIIHADHNFNAVSDDTLRRWFASMAEQGLKLELEVGAIKEWSPNSGRTFEIEKLIWDRVNRLGGNIASIAMDEPLDAAKSMLHKSDVYAIEETARFVVLVRQNFPSMRIGDIEAYPFTPVADHIRWVDALNTRLVQLGVGRLDFYRVDPDWNAFPGGGNWAGVKQIVDACQARGLRSSVIIWSAKAAGHKKDGLSDLAWHDGVVSEAGNLKAVGIRPDQIIIESWIGLPARGLPETDAATFTGSIEAVLEVYKQRARTLPASVAPQNRVQP